ncbi:signal peptidase I [Clostridium tetanomorphum]|nr:signal peptidase I [Clostridium tetanomorphum]KAJ49625.1 signal peptidase [Clostridium tetanomorphum DSM 665]KAJ52441.1 signal peptidase [Clostridium tetanomorphum DSM 665]MBP1864720.1 signal peptidase I [Clostridium tetanomorphum]NRS83897.1 signal peptidase I [Clostridium tetanomorphum]NRZ97118.1 signal peptidase I [Clostridium tetanomorphum]
MNNNETKNRNENLFKEIKDYAFSIGMALLMALVFHSYVFARANVDGPSMQPTLQDKDSIFIEKITTNLKNFKRGEIIVFDSKNENHEYYVKRIIGVAGDKIELKDSHVYLNGKLLKEDYLAPETITEPTTATTQYIVPEGYVFVLGDNRTNSTDSRMLGPINVSDIKGHVVIRFLPFDKLKMF